MMKWPWRRKARATREIDWLLRRKSDGTLWVAGAPQNLGYAMRGLFNKRDAFHFHKARWHDGRLIVAPRIFWTPQSGEFTMDRHKGRAIYLGRWTEAEECRRIDAKRALQRLAA